MNLKELLEERAAKQAEMKAILDMAKQENRSLNEEENTKFSALEKEIRDLDNTINAIQTSRELELNAPVVEKEEEKKPSPLAKAPEAKAAPEAKPAFKSNAFAPSPFAPGAPKKPEVPSPFVPLKSSQPKTLDKTFIPLAPIPEEKHQEEETFNPFAPRVEKTEEQLRIEEENARRALENSRREPKKSALGAPTPYKP
jgi:hypothetical protein